MSKKTISVEEIKIKALEARKMLIKASVLANSIHLGSSLSEMDILEVLYGHFLEITPETTDDPTRDRFILSKGHAGLGLYVVLSQYGFISEEIIMSYAKNGTKLAAHPVLGSALGIEATSGSLGHGLPIASGMAIAGKRNGWKSKYVVLLSDGECDEGSNWEAIMLAGHLQLDNLVVIIDYNKIQSFGTVAEVLDLEPFVDKWRANRWCVTEVDGHDISKMVEVFDTLAFRGMPNVIIAHTIKGKGIPKFEDTLESHYKSVKEEELKEVLNSIY